jgi:hypothetical protein
MRPFSEYTTAAEKAFYDLGVILIAAPFIIVMAPFCILKGMYTGYRDTMAVLRPAIKAFRQQAR